MSSVSLINALQIAQEANDLEKEGRVEQAVKKYDEAISTCQDWNNPSDNIIKEVIQDWKLQRENL